jgi:hypothetical protein
MGLLQTLKVRRHQTNHSLAESDDIEHGRLREVLQFSRKLLNIGFLEKKVSDFRAGAGRNLDLTFGGSLE